MIHCIWVYIGLHHEITKFVCLINRKHHSNWTVTLNVWKLKVFSGSSILFQTLVGPRKRILNFAQLLLTFGSTGMLIWKLNGSYNYVFSYVFCEYIICSVFNNVDSSLQLRNIGFLEVSRFDHRVSFGAKWFQLLVEYRFKPYWYRIIYEITVRITQK